LALAESGISRPKTKTPVGRLEACAHHRDGA
jgi:hypothetical protein